MLQHVYKIEKTKHVITRVLDRENMVSCNIDIILKNVITYNTCIRYRKNMISYNRRIRKHDESLVLY